MPRVKRYFPVSHDINDDPEVWEFTNEFGDRSFRTFMEVLRTLDKNENRLAISDQWYAAVSRKLRQTSVSIRRQVGWMLARGWLANHEPPDSGLPVVLYARKYWDFHRRPEHNGTDARSHNGTLLSDPILSVPTIPKRREKKDSSPPSPEAIEIAQLLSDKIFENFPNRTAPTEATLTAWAHDADRIHVIDGHSWEDIRSLLEWSQCDDFWRQNILSLSKFRKQWNQLIARRESSLTSRGGSKIHELRSRSAMMLKRGIEE